MKFTVIYVNRNERWQFFQCLADDDEHAERLWLAADSSRVVLWVNPGHGPASQTME